VRPALVATVLIVAVRALGSFEIPAILGIPGGVWVFTSRLWRAATTYPVDLAEAGAYALPLLVLTSVGIAVYSRLTRRARRFETVTGKGYRPRPMPLGRWRRPVTGLVLAYFVVSFLLPFLALVYVSTQPYYRALSRESLSQANLDSYAAALSDDAVLTGAKNSLVLSAGTATAAMVMMAVCAWLVLRTRLPGRRLLDQLTFVPIAVPGLVLGVSLLFVYLRVPLPIYGTLWILFIAYFTRAIPYGMRYASVSMAQIGRELEESAAVSGSPWLQTFRRVLLPLLVPGLLAGWIHIFLVSLRELSSSLLLYSPGNEVLPVVLWRWYGDGRFTQVAALGVVTTIVFMLLAVIARRLSARVGVREV
jgi:iron(III) transport system permease protein